MNATFIQRMETLRWKVNVVIEDGTFANLPADEFGITPETRLQWGIDSIIYIIGISMGCNLDSMTCDETDQMLITTCHTIEAQSCDPYIAEGIYNIRWVLTILRLIVGSSGCYYEETPSDDIMNELYYQKVKAIVLERQIDRAKTRYNEVNREAKRLQMLLNQVEDTIEARERSATSR